MMQRTIFFLLLLGGGLLLAFRPSLPLIPSVEREDVVVAGALDRLADEDAPDFQLKAYQEKAWELLRGEGIEWKAPEWFLDMVEQSNNKREAFRGASLRLYPESRRK